MSTEKQPISGLEHLKTQREILQRRRDRRSSVLEAVNSMQSPEPYVEGNLILENAIKAGKIKKAKSENHIPSYVKSDDERISEIDKVLNNPDILVQEVDAYLAEVKLKASQLAQLRRIAPFSQPEIIADAEEQFKALEAKRITDTRLKMGFEILKQREEAQKAAQKPPAKEPPAVKEPPKVGKTEGKAEGKETEILPTVVINRKTGDISVEQEGKKTVEFEKDSGARILLLSLAETESKKASTDVLDARLRDAEKKTAANVYIYDLKRKLQDYPSLITSEHKNRKASYELHANVRYVGEPTQKPAASPKDGEKAQGKEDNLLPTLVINKETGEVIVEIEGKEETVDIHKGSRLETILLFLAINKTTDRKTLDALLEEAGSNTKTKVAIYKLREKFPMLPNLITSEVKNRNASYTLNANVRYVGEPTQKPADSPVKTPEKKEKAKPKVILDTKSRFLIVDGETFDLNNDQYALVKYVYDHRGDELSVRDLNKVLSEIGSNKSASVILSELNNKINKEIGKEVFVKSGKKTQGAKWSLPKAETPKAKEEFQPKELFPKTIEALRILAGNAQVSAQEILEILGPSQKTGKLLLPNQAKFSLDRSIGFLRRRISQGIATKEEADLWQEIKTMLGEKEDDIASKVLRGEISKVFPKKESAPEPKKGQDKPQEAPIVPEERTVMILDNSTKALTIDGNQIGLNEFEYKLISYMYEHYGQENLASYLNKELYNNKLSVESVANRVREKTGKDIFRSIGRGRLAKWKLSDDIAPSQTLKKIEKSEEEAIPHQPFSAQEAAFLANTILNKKGQKIQFPTRQFVFEVPQDIQEACNKLVDNYRTANKSQRFNAKQASEIKASIVEKMANILTHPDMNKVLETYKDPDLNLLLLWIYLHNDDVMRGTIVDFIKANPSLEIKKDRQDYIGGVTQDPWAGTPLYHLQGLQEPESQSREDDAYSNTIPQDETLPVTDDSEAKKEEKPELNPHADNVAPVAQEGVIFEEPKVEEDKPENTGAAAAAKLEATTEPKIKKKSNREKREENEEYLATVAAKYLDDLSKAGIEHPIVSARLTQSFNSITRVIIDSAEREEYIALERRGNGKPQLSLVDSVVMLYLRDHKKTFNPKDIKPLRQKVQEELDRREEAKQSKPSKPTKPKKAA